jgi:hypothetical protein
MTPNQFPPGWDERKVQEILAHYEGQTEDEAVAEAEAAFDDEGNTLMVVPHELVPAVRQLIAKHQAPSGTRSKYRERKTTAKRRTKS